MPGATKSRILYRFARRRRALMPAPAHDGIVMTDRTPPIWILTGVREGDNAQVRQLALATGLDYVEKKLFYNELYKLPNTLKGRGLWTVRPDSGAELRAPWPRVAIGVGRRSVPVSRWIKKASNNFTRLVQVGRPRLALGIFDLIVTTPQYRLPVRPNVLQLPLPLSRLRGADLKKEAAVWKHIARGLKRPLTSVLVGGDTNTFRLGKRAAENLGRLVSAHAAAAGGSLLVTTSPRTTRDAEQALVNALTVPAYVYRWSEAGGESNPYLGLLSLADDIVVTSDSASLLSDAVIVGKPIHLFETPKAPNQRYRSNMHTWFNRIEQCERDKIRPSVPLRILRKIADTGVINAPRHLPQLFDDLDRIGLIHRLGDDLSGNGGTQDLKECCDRVLAEAVSRIKVMVDAPR